MVGAPEGPEELRSLRMERPILRQHTGEVSPILLQWYEVERATDEDFDENGNYKGEGEGVPRERQPQLRLRLRRLQKEVDREKVDGDVE